MMQRHLIFVGIVMLVMTSLACSLGGSTNTPAPTDTPTSGQPQTTTAVAQATQPPIAQPTNTPIPPTPTDTPLSGTGPGGCVLNAAFVADVTIPDNQIEAPNASFVKTWRIKNTGTCTWDATYQLVFAEGNQMSGPASVPINVTAPGANVDVSVNLKAPGTPSATAYIGKWRLKASNGVIFGGVFVQIIVPLPPTATPTPSSTPTPTSTSTSGGPWSGHWDTSYNGMELLQTGNTVVGTYQNGVDTLSGTVNGNHLSGTWHEGASSGPFDFWMGSTGVKWRGSWNGTGTWCGHRTGETDPTPCGVGLFNGDWTVICGASVCDGAMHIDQDGRNFTGTYVNGTIEGTIDGNTATGHWHIGTTLQGGITWFLLNHDQFNGNYDTSNRWCGARNGSGASAPATCLAP